MENYKLIMFNCETVDDGIMTKAPVKSSDEGKTVTLPCGCVYQDKGWLLTRENECEYHRRKRTAKKQYRPKAECVRP